MARYDAQGGRIVTTMFEAAAWHFNIRATCTRCRHTNVLNRYAVWWRFECRGWDQGFRNAAGRFRCTDCGNMGARIEPVRINPTVNQLPVPMESDWKRAVSRFRS